MYSKITHQQIEHNKNTQLVRVYTNKQDRVELRVSLNVQFFNYRAIFLHNHYTYQACAQHTNSTLKTRLSFSLTQQKHNFSQSSKKKKKSSIFLQVSKSSRREDSICSEKFLKT